MAEKSIRSTEKPNSGWFGDSIRTIIYALLIAGVIRTLFFQPFWIPSGSMKSTLLIGDFLFVNKMSYGYSWASCPQIRTFNFCGFAREWDGRILGSEPERGDIIVFKHPVNGADYIKRLIGLPGDRVQMKDGRLLIDGVEVPQEPDGVFEEILERQGPVGNMPRCRNRPVAPGGVCEKDRYQETLPNGVRHAVLDIESGFSDNTPAYTVPDGHYLFIGDNRDNSQDGRFPQSMGGVGFVPFGNLVGRADRVVFSSSGSWIINVLAWRKDRYFKRLD
ncbi:MAG: signal peptidase I [Paracoccaceae bacterium]|nr:signal peptidase I [Paracoccaceae bacterium]MDE2913121.1 signal peptidase I [Paracoccaceae bacterium]